jgi:hypothetical protein
MRVSPAIRAAEVEAEDSRATRGSPAIRAATNRSGSHRAASIVRCEAASSRGEGMGKGRKIVALAVAIAALAVTLGAPAASAAPNCSPGQHGNPHPEFKPGSC